MRASPQTTIIGPCACDASAFSAVVNQFAVDIGQGINTQIDRFVGSQAISPDQAAALRQVARMLQTAFRVAARPGDPLLNFAQQFIDTTLGEGYQAWRAQQQTQTADTNAASAAALQDIALGLGNVTGASSSSLSQHDLDALQRLAAALGPSVSTVPATVPSIVPGTDPALDASIARRAALQARVQAAVSTGYVPDPDTFTDSQIRTFRQLVEQDGLSEDLAKIITVFIDEILADPNTEADFAYGSTAKAPTARSDRPQGNERAAQIYDRVFADLTEQGVSELTARQRAHTSSTVVETISGLDTLDRAWAGRPLSQIDPSD